MVSVEELITNEDYRNYSVHTLNQLGNWAEYTEFFKMGTEPKKGELPLNNYMGYVNNQHGMFYAAGQFFIALGKGTGSTMHYANHVNVFTMLSGRKRWLLVSPKYFYEIGCKEGKQGLFGNCNPNNYYTTTPNIRFNID